MNMNGKQLLLIGAGVFVLLAGVAAASTYMARSGDAPKQETTRVIHHTQQAAAPSLPPCDDKNIVGTIAGGVAGGVLGNQIGSGSGRTVATVAGAAGGAYLGNEYLPTRNATCR